MSDHAIDTITRRAADVVSRRGSLLALGGAALAATMVTPAAAPAKKRASRARKQVRKTCRRKARECNTFFTPLCGGDPECKEEMATCCAHFGKCNVPEALECIFFCTCSDEFALKVRSDNS